MKRMFLFLVFFLLIDSLVAIVHSNPLERTVGVNVGDKFDYALDVSSNSNDPNAKPPSFFEEVEDLQYWNFTVSKITETNIEFDSITTFKNGTTQINTGYHTNVGNGSSWGALFISANLSVGDLVYDNFPYLWIINETIPFTYIDTTRNTNHLNVSIHDFLAGYNYPEEQYDVQWNLYWDKTTGVQVLSLISYINQTNDYTTTWVYSIQLVDTNIWVVPEFPSLLLVLPLFMIATLLAVIVYKRKHQTRNKKREV